MWGVVMSNENIRVISFFVIISILFWLVPLALFIFQYIRQYKSKAHNPKSLESRLMFCSLSLVGAIWCLRFATSYYDKVAVTFHSLSVVEMALDSLFRALQTMTMNEECSAFIVLGKSMIEDICIAKNIDLCVFLYGIYASILDLLAPITGAAALFSILTMALPKFKLKCSFLKKQYYFSELNERSIALAKSIINKETKFWNHPVLVFTDVYVDNENEKISELYLIAKKMGAICVKDDIVHLKIKTLKEKEIFLMDKNENDNIKHLSELNSGQYKDYLKNTTIYVFYQDDSYALIENKIKSDIAKRYVDSTKSPVIIRVKEYENLILGLLSKKPLIEPLLRNFKDGLPYPAGDRTCEYNLTIIGSGKIGLQMLLSSSWCGQFYGYKLNINVVSNVSKSDFERDINNFYPEFIESTKTNSPSLKVYSDFAIMNEPYFNLRYGEYDFNKISLSDVKCVSFTDDVKKDFKIIDSDYFLIALGNDEANMLAAEKLKRQISVTQYQQSNEKHKNRVIAFAVYNEKFNETLRESSFDGDYKIELFPFAGVEETYGYKNITSIDQDPAAILVGKSYQNQTFKEMTIEEKRENQAEQDKKIYDIMSSKARAVHFKYRIFSAFLLNKNDVSSDEFTWEELYDFDDKTIDIYSDFALSDEAKEKRDKALQYLTWLEHRRWNAYMRSIGFSYDSQKGKNIELKLHGCLCECSRFPLSGYSNIRLNDLKNRLYDYIYSNVEISKEGFEECIKSWTRLPQANEQVQVDGLLKTICNDFDGTISTIHKSIMDAKLKCRIEIEDISKSTLSADDKDAKIEEISQKYNKEMYKKYFKYFDDIVDKCLLKDSIAHQTDNQYDMLDLYSKNNGYDIKYFDFPHNTDNDLIEAHKKLKNKLLNL